MRASSRPHHLTSVVGPSLTQAAQTTVHPIPSTWEIQANCYLGHIQKTQMSPQDVSAADALFKTAYTK
jgi:hypothetical protein